LGPKVHVSCEFEEKIRNFFATALLGETKYAFNLFLLTVYDIRCWHCCCYHCWSALFATRRSSGFSGGQLGISKWIQIQLAKNANMRGRKNISKNSKWSQKTKVNVDFETVEQKLKSKITENLFSSIFR
jgi:hypothetical protein